MDQAILHECRTVRKCLSIGQGYGTEQGQLVQLAKALELEPEVAAELLVAVAEPQAAAMAAVATEAIQDQQELVEAY